jgi:hypothetical protein
MDATAAWLKSIRIRYLNSTVSYCTECVTQAAKMTRKEASRSRPDKPMRLIWVIRTGENNLWQSKGEAEPSPIGGNSNRIAPNSGV